MNAEVCIRIGGSKQLAKTMSFSEWKRRTGSKIVLKNLQKNSDDDYVYFFEDSEGREREVILERSYLMCDKSIDESGHFFIGYFLGYYKCDSAYLVFKKKEAV